LKPTNTHYCSFVQKSEMWSRLEAESTYLYDGQIQLQVEE